LRNTGIYCREVGGRRNKVWGVYDESLYDNWYQLLQMCKFVFAFYFNMFWCREKGKATPAQGWTGAEGFRNSWLSDFKTVFTRNFDGAGLCWRMIRSRDHSAAGSVI
jgi:hypothetical protein